MFSYKASNFPRNFLKRLRTDKNGFNFWLDFTLLKTKRSFVILCSCWTVVVAKFVFLTDQQASRLRRGHRSLEITS